MNRTRKEVRFGLLCLPMLAAGLFISSSASAQVIISAQSVAAVAGSTGDAFDVTLRNDGPGSIDVAAFAFEVTVGGTDITLTDVTTGTTTATYIFNGNSLFGPSIGTPVSAQDMMASDVTADATAVTVGAGDTVGLGHVHFNVSSTASGSYPLTILAFPATSLSDANAGNIDFTANDGAIRVTGPSTPEPGAFALLAAVAVPGAWFMRRRR